FKNSIIALNTFTGDGFAPDIYAPNGLTSLGYNLVGIKDGGAVYTDAPGDQIGSSATPLDPLLGALQDNGGPTFTRALLAGSTARPLIEWNSGAGIEGVHVWMSADFGEGGQGPGSIFVNLTDTLGTHHIFSSAPNLLAPAVWQHVAVTYDKTSGVAKIYLNGS